MYHKTCFVFALFVSFACRYDDGGDQADAAPVGADAFVGPTDEDIMAGYEPEVRLYPEKMDVSPEWVDWMIVGKQVDDAHPRGKVWWSKAYISPRRYDDHNVRIYVRYEDPEHPLIYTPAWESEAEHFTALKKMAQLQYPGWTFTFLIYQDGDENRLEGNDAIAILGGHGTSYASGHTVYLVYETIFAHEFGHTLGLHHHYCGGSGTDHCPENFPPGEGQCIMARDSVSWGPTENSFLLLTNGDRKDAEISVALNEILRRYPPNFAAATWDECGMEENE